MSRLRHTAATLMHEAGADIRHLQELLSHEDLSTTQVYTRVAIKKLQEVHARTHPARNLLRDAARAPSSPRRGPLCLPPLPRAARRGLPFKFRR